ncbi:MAG: carbon-nitrogen hydrolase family protein [Pseudomonadota bacterium]
MTKFNAAMIQLNSNDNIADNISVIQRYLREAKEAGADFVSLPENAFFLSSVSKAIIPDPIEALEICKSLARELGLFLLIGSVHFPDISGKHYNRSVLINNHGKISAQYDKIHLFDAELKNGEVYRESARIIAGNEAVLVNTPFGKIGMSVCYDLRFPHLHRTLAQNGADFLSIPAAFTYTTGIAHWHTLLRARAIENGCYVFAPAQCGVHPGNRRTYGHSLIISPWGEILAEDSETETGIIIAEIDTDKILETRSQLASLGNKSEFILREY